MLELLKVEKFPGNAPGSSAPGRQNAWNENK